MLRIGYICDIDLVSNRGTDEQSSIPPQMEADRAALVAAGCKVIRVETARPPRSACGVVMQSVVDFAEQGDEIVVTRLNQIGSSSAAVLGLLQTLKSRGIGLRLLDAGLNRPGLVDDAFIQTLEMICSLDGRLGNRQMANAGTGRRNRVTTDDIRSLQARGMGAGQIAETLHVSRMTIWRKLKEA
jgi:DNA invertase Pin-like site-specific DNA recombinase